MEEREMIVVKKRLKLNKKNLFWVLTGLGLIIVIIVGIIFAVSMVNKNSKICIAYFESSGGSLVDSVQFKCGKEIINKPSNPTKEGFKFLGWYLDNKKFDFASVPNKDVRLSARWESDGTKEVVKVVLNTNGGTDMDDVELIKGTRLVITTTPEKEGYKFLGWFIDDVEFDFTKEINENIELKAKWEIIKDANNNNINTLMCSGIVGPSQTVQVEKYKTYGIGAINPGLKYNSECSVTFKSSDINIATVQNNGQITTHNEGTAYIYACLTDKKTKIEIDCYKGTLIVREANNEDQNIRSIRLEIPDEHINVEDVFVIKIEADSYIGSIHSLIKDVRMSNNNVIAIRDKKYLQFEAINEGTVGVEVELENGVVGYIQVSVEDNRIKPVILQDIIVPSEITVEVGESKKLEFTPVPADVKYTMWGFTYDYTSFDIDSNGVITGIKANPSANLEIAFSGTGNASPIVKKFKVNVVPAKLKGMAFDKTNISLNVGEMGKINVIANPAGASVEGGTWESSDKSVANVISGEIYAHKKGVATITYKKSGFTVTCNVTVSEIDLQSISLNKGNLNLKPGANENLSVIFNPSNATNKNVVWSSNNYNVATVDQNGKVTAVADGTATITASSNGKSASAIVTVETPPLTGEASVGYTTKVTSSGVVSGVSVRIIPSGGSENYVYYYIELYKNGVLLQSGDTNELIASGHKNGTYYAKFTIKDSKGNVYNGVSPETTININF